MKRLSMTVVRAIISLSFTTQSHRQIAKVVKRSRDSINSYIERAHQAKITKAELDQMTDSELKSRLFPAAVIVRKTDYIEPDWEHVHSEHTTKRAHLRSLRQEYLDPYKNDPECLSGQLKLYSYSRFCQRYRNWRGKTDYTMFQHHLPGDKVFLDHAGRKLPIIDPVTGEIHDCDVFVATMGASNLIYCEATMTQQKRDFFASNVRMFEYFGGAPRMVVIDNPKSAVFQACNFEPIGNESYLELINHYHTTLGATRPHKPKDKAKVERSVGIIYSDIFDPLRNQKFFSVEELNAAIRPLLDQLNNRYSKHLGGSRRELFEKLDRPELKQLPSHPYEYFDSVLSRVDRGYHVTVETNKYSVPYQLIKDQVVVHLYDRRVAIYHNDNLVAEHPRGFGTNQRTTKPEHMPAEHRAYAETNPESLLKQAEEIGPHITKYFSHILSTCAHPHKGTRTCVGVLSLVKKYGADHLEQACAHAASLHQYSYSSLKLLLKDKLVVTNLSQSQPPVPIQHCNNRGRDYFQ